MSSTGMSADRKVMATIRKMALISDVIDNHFYPYNEDQDTSLENRRTGMYKGLVYA